MNRFKIEPWLFWVGVYVIWSMLIAITDKLVRRLYQKSEVDSENVLMYGVVIAALLLAIML